METEYRAIFGNPYNGDRTYGPVRETFVEALEERPERSEETHRYVIGVEKRKVDPWAPMSLSEVLANPNISG